jgi:hypothetical protein
MHADFFAQDIDPESIAIMHALEETPLDVRDRERDAVPNILPIAARAARSDEVFQRAMAKVEQARKVHDAGRVDVVESNWEFREVRLHGHDLSGFGFISEFQAASNKI